MTYVYLSSVIYIDKNNNSTPFADDRYKAFLNVYSHKNGIHDYEENYMCIFYSHPEELVPSIESNMLAGHDFEKHTRN